MFDELKRRFDRPGVTVIAWHGLPAVELAAPAARAVVTLLGAQVVEFAPAGQKETLFISEKSEFCVGKAIRGGVPICFPWFGAPPEGRSGSHGWARNAEWELLTAERGRAVFGLEREGFRLRYTVTAGAELDLHLEVANVSDREQTYSGALHTYLAVGDATRADIAGLDGVKYFDSLTGETHLQSGPVAIDREVDRVYFTSAATVVTDPVLGRRFTVAKTGSRSTVIWNPWIAKSRRMPDFGDGEYPNMLCVEAANVPAAGDARTLAPGATGELSQTVTVTPLN